MNDLFRISPAVSRAKLTFRLRFRTPESDLSSTVNDGMVPEELYETDGRDDTVNEGMVPEELYEADGRDDNVNPGTGFKGFAAAIAVTGACGAAAVAAYRFGKKK